MKRLLKYLFCLMTGILLFSCQKNNSHEKLLTQAQDSLIIGKPEITLNLLDSILDTQGMDKETYMQYIVTYVGARKETKADISRDTLILQAQSYFNDKRDFKNSALANYYAGWVYYTNNKLPESLESFMNAADAAAKSNNYILAAKSFNNIGYIYFGRILFDSAIINYRKALQYYDRVDNADKNKIQVLTNIGRAYEGYNKLDSAYQYFSKGLELAKKIGNKQQERQLYQNLGVTCYGMQDYDKSVEYFESALTMNTSSKEEITQINLHLLNIYNKKGVSKSAGQYAALVTTDLPKVSYIHTVKEIYSSLADYYYQTGNYKQALEYRDLEIATKELIEQETDAPALLDADKNFYLIKHKREAEAFRADALFILILVVSAFCILLVFFLLVWRRHKKDQAEIQFYGHKYDELRQVLYDKTDEYPKIEAEIKAMLEDDE